MKVITGYQIKKIIKRFLRNPLIDLTVTLTIFGFFFYVIFCRAPEKNTVHEISDFLENFLSSVLPKITQ